MSTGDTTVLHCVTISYPTATVQWYHYPTGSGLPVAIDVTSQRHSVFTNNSLKIQSLILEDNGIYSCNVSNEYGYTVLNHTLTVNGKLIYYQ